MIFRIKRCLIFFIFLSLLTSYGYSDRNKQIDFQTLAPQNSMVLVQPADIQLTAVMKKIAFLLSGTETLEELYRRRAGIGEICIEARSDLDAHLRPRYFTFKKDPATGIMSLGFTYQDYTGKYDKIYYFKQMEVEADFLGESAASREKIHDDLILAEIDNMEEQIEKELGDPGSAILPTTCHTTDPHGAYERLKDLVIYTLKDELEEFYGVADITTLRKLLRDPDKLALVDKTIIFGGDMSDRAVQPMETFDLIRRVVNSGIGKFVMGNHDQLNFVTVQGIHLPFYDGFEGIPAGYRGYAYKDGEFRADVDMNQLLIDTKAEDSEEARLKFKDRNWWSVQLRDFMKRSTRLQNTLWADLNNEVVSQFEGFYNIGRKQVEDDMVSDLLVDPYLVVWWARILGRNFKEIDVYTGFRSASEMSITWWQDRLQEMDILFDKDEYKTGAGAELVKFIREKIEFVIQTEVDYMRSLGDTDEGFAHAIFDAININNYTSLEYYGRDWLYHGSYKTKGIITGRAWGPGSVFNLVKIHLFRAYKRKLNDELRFIEADRLTYAEVPKPWVPSEEEALRRYIDENRDALLAAGKDLDELEYADIPSDWLDLTYYDYFAEYKDAQDSDLPGPHNIFKFREFIVLANFFRANFNLYYRDEFGNYTMHGFPNVVSDVGSLYEAGFTYKGVYYFGETFFEGLRIIQTDVQDMTAPLPDIYEALSVVYSWYADNTVSVKPLDMKRYLEVIVPDDPAGRSSVEKIIDDLLTVNILLFGHAPDYSMAAQGVPHNLFNKALNNDGGMGVHYKGRGAVVILNRDGVHFYGFNSKNDAEIKSDSEGYMVWDENSPDPKNLKLREPSAIDAKTYLEQTLQKLRETREHILNKRAERDVERLVAESMLLIAA